MVVSQIYRYLQYTLGAGGDGQFCSHQTPIGPALETFSIKLHQLFPRSPEVM